MPHRPKVPTISDIPSWGSPSSATTELIYTFLRVRA